jgi:hypothetical protein
LTHQPLLEAAIITRRELALLNLAIDSKFRACDLLRFRVRDVRHGGGMVSRAIAVSLAIVYLPRVA